MRCLRVVPSRLKTKMILRLLPALIVLVSGGRALAQDMTQLRAQVAKLGSLTAAPAVYPAEGFAPEVGMQALFFEALSWQGKPTRVFAWLGIPDSAGVTLPGIVLVHGGGGTAFKEWVRKWNERGFAAISIAVEGQTDERNPEATREAQWSRHQWAGPARNGIYGDSAEPLDQQWMYHAVADTILANSLLRSRTEVAAANVGVMGISWGGVITSTVIGIDGRFAFAIPTYGCGHLADSENQYGRALGENRLYREVWDPMVRLSRAHLPVLWLSWPQDQHFPLDCQAASYRAALGPRLVVLRPGMKHSHPAGWNPPDSYAFAESIVQEGKPWLRQTAIRRSGSEVSVGFAARKRLDSAMLICTADSGFTGQRTWREAPAELRKSGDGYFVTAGLPPGTTAWFVNVHAGELIGSSDFETAGTGP